ncbi:MAG TPA: 50S ribosomal protein L11 methyltransferase [Candidatus Polarisedimenticolaceae bacterium]|nr:50S ribosomal protein L11 methyltransferase [Candidatus Polarisedimenticolaceae bacterium]
MWRMLSAVVPSSVEDEVASVLGGGSLGVEIEPAGPGASTLRVYLGEADDEEAWRRRAARVLEAHGIATALRVEDVADARWVEKWQAALAPIPLGRRFVVLPGSARDADPGRDPIVLVPGMAFGTGEHETTRMCAAALEDLVRPGSSWVDVGTGTGILAIVAVRCGASRVVAVDNDPEAAHVAREVVARNRAETVIDVVEGSLDAASGAFDGVVANVQSSFFLSQAQALASAVRPGGHLVVSGIVADDAGEVVAALHGFVLDEQRRDGPWACLLLIRAR